jgi:hypothetical protein
MKEILTTEKCLVTKYTLYSIKYSYKVHSTIFIVQKDLVSSGTFDVKKAHFEID